MNSCFVDTNIFLRFLLRDQEPQFQTAKALFEKAVSREVKLHSSIIVFFEIYWVLSSFYRQDKTKIIDYLKKILTMGIIEFEQETLLKNALNFYECYSIDLEDSYNIVYTRNLGINQFISFDEKVKKVFEK